MDLATLNAEFILLEEKNLQDDSNLNQVKIKKKFQDDIYHIFRIHVNFRYVNIFI
jgi:hypothetical protein